MRALPTCLLATALVAGCTNNPYSDLDLSHRHGCDPACAAGGPSGTAEFASPQGVSVDSAGKVYVGDTNNQRIRVIHP